MKNAIRKLSLLGILSLLVVAGLLITVKSKAQGRESANGHGTWVTQDTDGRKVRRQFSFEAHRNSDGTVSGHAILHNANFTGANGKTYQAQFDISCMKVIGNTAFFGGFVRRTNDPNLVDAAYFSVQDNGEPGKDRDLLSSVFFFDDDPNTTGSPALCQGNTLGDFPMFPIDSGNIQVRSGQ